MALKDLDYGEINIKKRYESPIYKLYAHHDNYER